MTLLEGLERVALRGWSSVRGTRVGKYLRSIKASYEPMPNPEWYEEYQRKKTGGYVPPRFWDSFKKCTWRDHLAAIRDGASLYRATWENGLGKPPEHIHRSFHGLPPLPPEPQKADFISMTPEERATELERLRTEYYLTDEDLAQYRAKIEDALDEAKERSEPLRDHMKVVATNRLELLKLSLEEFRIGYSQSRDDERAHLEKASNLGEYFEHRSEGFRGLTDVLRRSTHEVGEVISKEAQEWETLPPEERQKRAVELGRKAVEVVTKSTTELVNRDKKVKAAVEAAKSDFSSAQDVISQAFSDFKSFREGEKGRRLDEEFKEYDKNEEYWEKIRKGEHPAGGEKKKDR